MRGSWILTALGVCAAGITGLMLADGSSAVAFLSPFVAGSGLLWFATLLGAWIDHRHQTAMYGNPDSDGR
ncbi:hypothetical protein CTB96_19510 [Cryobacterium arcticum]|uniref:Uncharacterized protein n=1 Tax=Cryobacterium arcticum TaxID=670052 RepID=A0A317ZJM3_9MICO|nr:hypothetical protein CTB96_19510 [Cryobacterium arcticum]